MSRYIDILNDGKSRLSKASITDYNTDAWLLFEEAFSIDRAAYFTRQLDECTDYKAIWLYNQMIDKRCTHVPLQHITGHQEFMGLDFKVNDKTLIPRCDTECLVEETLKRISSYKEKTAKMQILDMCTGSGCIAISVAKLADCTVSVTGVDVSKEALRVADMNRSIHKADNVTFIESNLFEFCGGKNEQIWDIIVSNPPYIPAAEIEQLEDEVRLHDPRIALDGMEDGLYFYRVITAKAAQYLNSGGCLLYEIGCNQARDVSEIMRESGFTGIKVLKDMSGLDRVVSGNR